MAVGSGVFINDTDLVFLYRFTDFDAAGAEVLDNVSESPIYSGFNTMSVSGAISSAPTKIHGPDGTPGAPLSSGAEMSGAAGEIFHLPYSPVQSGNASGIDVSSTTDFSYGGWLILGDNGTAQFLDYFGKYAVAATTRNYVLQATSGSNPEWAWQARIGISNGSNTVNVRGTVPIACGIYEHVVVTVDSSVASNNVRLYQSGVLVGSGSATISPGASGSHPPVRIGGNTSATSESILNAVPGVGKGGAVAEFFFMRRLLNEFEVSGIYMSGFQPTAGVAGSGFSHSDELDTRKDDIGAQATSTSDIQMTAWNANEQADPTGLRHMTSGYHPAWLKILNVGGGSGLNFGEIKQGTASGIKAVTFRNTTDGTNITNMRFWANDLSAFSAVSGYDIALHINSKWLPNLVLPSGSGVVGKSLAAASSVLRSDLGTIISGYVLDGVIPSGEQEISQYIYLSFDTNNNFTPSTYGPNGFEFRLTVDNI